MMDMAKEHGALLPRKRGGRPSAPALSPRGSTLKRLLRAPLLSPWAQVIGKTLVVFLALLSLAALGHASLARSAQAGALPAASQEAASAEIPDDSEHPPALVRGSPDAATPEERQREADAPAKASPILPDGRIVLNLASEGELTKLPGIGPKRAEAIVSLRARLGRFRRVEDLLRVKGIGRKMLVRLRPAVVVDAPPE